MLTAPDQNSRPLFAAKYIKAFYLEHYIVLKFSPRTGIYIHVDIIEVIYLIVNKISVMYIRTYLYYNMVVDWWLTKNCIPWTTAFQFLVMW